MSILVKAIETSTGQFDIVGVISGSIYGTLRSKELVARVTNNGPSGAPPKQLTLADFSTEELEAQLQQFYTDRVKSVASMVAKYIRNQMNDGAWGLMLVANTEEKIDSTLNVLTHTETCTLAGKIMTEAKAKLYLRSLITGYIAEHGINPFDPCPVKPVLPEEEIDHLPPDHVDVDAVALADKLIAECAQDDLTARTILYRAKSYLENVDEALDLFRLPNPGMSTHAFAAGA